MMSSSILRSANICADGKGASYAFCSHGTVGGSSGNLYSKHIESPKSNNLTNTLLTSSTKTWKIIQDGHSGKTVVWII